jgi:PAS domain S-box-containing protein
MCGQAGNVSYKSAARMSAQPTKVLIVEDSKMDSALLMKTLEASAEKYSVRLTTQVSEAVEVATHEHFDVIICDLSLPDSTGLDTVKKLRWMATRSAIIVISGTEDTEVALQAVRQGAQDYLVKGQYHAAELRRTIRYAIERHRLQTALHESEKHFRRLLEATTDYTYRVTLDNGQAVKTEHSLTCASVTGYTPVEYQTDPRLWLRMVHPDDEAAVIEQAKRASTGEAAPTIEHRILHRDGSLRWVRNTVVPHRDENGKLIGYDGLIRDITARKMAEEQLVRSEAFYHALVETLPQHILRKDLNERFTFANQKFCDLVGKPLSELIGKTDFDFFHPELARKYQADDRHVIKTGETIEIIEENQAPHGEKRYVNVIKTPIHDVRGRIIGIQGIFWDITEKKRAEEQLRKANEDLRRSHEELKAAQLQLIQAAKMESIGTLAAGVAHEVKNPLATLTMGLSYLDRTMEKKDSNLATVLIEMRSAIQRADTVTRGLLDFAASRRLDMQAEDLNALIEQTLVLLRHIFTQQHIELVTNFAENLPAVSVEKNQIQQVFVNVLMNALHAMDKGGRLTITTEAQRLARSMHAEGSRTSLQMFRGDLAVIVTIEDSGPGIPQDNLEKIFDPFFTTKPTGVGTGLGLPVSKKIVELHGGMIEVSNRPEGGVRVTIILRAERTHEKESVAGR